MNSNQVYDQWFESLDSVDQELVQKVKVTDNDDYPFTIIAKLSAQARERGGYYYSEVGWTVMHRPLPTKAFYDAMNAEEKAEKEKKDQEYQQERNKEKAEKDRESEWIKTALDGYVCTTLMLKGSTKRQDAQGQGFKTGTLGTGVGFYPYSYKGHNIWEEHYGSAIRRWVPSTLADQLYQEQWQEYIGVYKGEGKLAFQALTAIVRGCSCHGDDLYKWAQKTFGEKKLTQMALAEAPIDISDRGSDHDRDIASKYYRIPVRDIESYTAKETVIGYGNASCKRGPRQTDEQWKEDSRKHGWVPLGEENNSKHGWPTKTDLEEEVKSSEDANDFFNEIFG
jgi:hypothetical protein